MTVGLCCFVPGRALFVRRQYTESTSKLTACIIDENRVLVKSTQFIPYSCVYEVYSDCIRQMYN